MKSTLICLGWSMLMATSFGGEEGKAQRFFMASKVPEHSSCSSSIDFPPVEFISPTAGAKGLDGRLMYALTVNDGKVEDVRLVSMDIRTEYDFDMLVYYVLEPINQSLSQGLSSSVETDFDCTITFRFNSQ